MSQEFTKLAPSRINIKFFKLGIRLPWLKNYSTWKFSSGQVLTANQTTKPTSRQVWVDNYNYIQIKSDWIPNKIQVT